VQDGKKSLAKCRFEEANLVLCMRMQQDVMSAFIGLRAKS